MCYRVCIIDPIVCISRLLCWFDDLFMDWGLIDNGKDYLHEGRVDRRNIQFLLNLFCCTCNGLGFVICRSWSFRKEKTCFDGQSGSYFERTIFHNCRITEDFWLEEGGIQNY